MATLSGRTIDKHTGQPVPGLSIELWDFRRRINKPIAVFSAGAAGNFKSVISDSYLARKFGRLRPSKVYFKIYQEEILILSTKQTLVWNLAEDLIGIEIAVTIAKPEGQHYSVSGTIRLADSTPFADAKVVVFDKDLRHEQFLGTTLTDIQGRYTITYSQSQFRRAEKNSADVLVRVYNGEDKLMTESDIVFNVQTEEIVDLSITGEEPEQSEYEQLLAELEPVMEEVKIDQLTPEDVSFLAGETGWESRLITNLVSAAKLADGTGLATSVYYGLICENLPVDRFSLLRQGQEAQRRALDSAVNNKRIPALSVEEQNKILDQLQNLFIESMLDHPEEPRTHHLSGILATTLLPLSRNQKIVFLKLHLQAKPVEDVWESLRKNPEFQQAGLLDELKLIVQVGNLTQNHLPLVRTLQKMRKLEKFVAFRELARLTTDEWVSLIIQSREEQGLIVPENITGDTEEKKIEDYARQLRERLENQFPTLSIAYRIEQDNLPNHETLTAFFNRSVIDRERFNSEIPEFDFATTHIDRYLEDHAELVLVGNTDHEELSLQLKTMQRLFRLTPYYDELRPLLLNGLHSAQSIVRMGAGQFVKRFALHLGDESRATELYDKAEHQNAMALALMLKFSPTFSGVNPALVPNVPQPSEKDLAIIPDWSSLFGSLDFCACKHCQSVYSPAAYLVDGLHFLKQACPAKTPNKTAKEVLFDRRTDIGKIELSCANTNTPVPYIDLVNEILENTIAPSNVIPQTRDSAEEIGANPEYINLQAYDKLSQQVYPWGLPFDLWAEECRVYLQQLGASRYQIMEVFCNQPHADCLIDQDIAQEYLRLTGLEWAIVTGFDRIAVSPYQIWEYWGYPKTPEPSGWLEAISHVPSFLQKSGLSHSEFIELLSTRVVNPDPANRILDISPADTCWIEEMTLNTQSGYTDAELKTKLYVIHRFIRLQRKLGWSMLDLDRAFTTLKPKDRFGTLAPTSAFLVQLSHIERLRKLLKLPVVNLLSFWSDIDTINYQKNDRQRLPSLYDKLFQNKTIVGGNVDYLKAFALNNFSATISEHGSALLAVLGIDAADLQLLQNFLELEDQLSLSALSILYRYVLLAKALKTKISELLVLKELSGIDPFDDTHTENALMFVETLQRVGAAGFSFPELNYLYWHRDDPVKPIGPTTQDLIQLSLALLNEFSRIDEAMQVDVPSEDLLRTYMSTVLDEKQVNAALKFLDGCPIKNSENEQVIDQYFGFFLPETPDYSELLNLSILTEESEKQRWKEKAIAYLLKFLMPFLRDQQQRSAIKQVLSETLTLDKLVTESLLDTLLQSQSDVTDPEQSAVDDFVMLKNAGLQATYKGTNSDHEIIEVSSIDPCINFDWGKAEPAEGIIPGTLQEVTWAGKLLAPSNDLYNFHLDVTGVADLVLTVEGIEVTMTASSSTSPQNSQSVSLSEGELYAIHLTYRPSDNEKPRIRLSWSGSSTGEAVIPQHLLYPEDSYGNFSKAYLLLWKTALLVNRFRLTVKEIEYLSQHSVDFEGLDFNSLPLETSTSSNVSVFFKQWERLYAFTNLRDSLPVKETGLTDVFVLAANPVVARKKLLEVTGWPWEKLFELPTEKLKNEIYLIKLRDQLALSYRLGTTTDDLKDWCQYPLDSEAAHSQAQTIKNTLKSRYKEQQWLELSKQLKDKLREHQRSALVAYVLVNPQVLNLDSLKDSNDLYDHLLIDVEMAACQMTSRIKQANSSLQLFVQRCLMGLEPEVKLDKSAANQWKWMKNYRVWEANRKVFLYPENWIEPELRDDKSPFFKEMENELLQGEINLENVETAFRNYLEKLDNVALLDVRGMYWQTEPGVNILHVFARSKGGDPFAYYYRQWIKGRYWTPWEKVTVDIQGDHLVPVVYNRRLRLYWPIFEQKTQENVDTTSDQPPKLHWEIKLAWSEYKNGKWSAKKISDGFIKSIDRAESDHKSNYAKDQYFFLPVVLQPDTDALLILCFEKPQTIIATYNVTKQPIPNGEWPEKGEWNVQFKTDTALGSFDIIGCHDTLVYFDLQKYFNGQSFFFRYPAIILGTDIPEQAFTEPASIDEWNSLQQAKWWYDYALPNLVLESSYKNEMIVEWSHRLPDNKDYLFVKPASVMLTNSTPGQFSLLFPNQYSSSEMSFDKWIDHTLKKGKYSVPERKALLPFYYKDDTRAFLILPRIISSSVLLDNSRLSIHGYSATTSNQNITLLYKYNSFYHPYSCRFISELNRHGIDGLLAPPDKDSDLKRQFSHNVYFDNQYRPSEKIEKPYPIEWIDFTYGGSYSLYNWELFFHAPLMIADRLMKNQRFEDAQQWFHYIFDPTVDDDPFDVPQLFQNIQKFLEEVLGLVDIDYDSNPKARRYWKIQPFFLNCLDQISIQQLMELMAFAKNLPEENRSRELLETMVDQWRKDPFKPHLIARMRTSAYQKTVVMKYLDNLIAWADNLFRRNTIESINEATQLYILAAKILGPRPAEIQPHKSHPVKTYDDLEPDLDAFSNAVVQIENHLFSSLSLKNDNLPITLKKKYFVPDLQSSVWPSVSSTLSSPSLYFCIPPNEDMLEYWDTISDRIFKVRHCMNIEGVVRQLPLFEPPINPALLVKAAASGLDLGSVLQDLYGPLPKYRFQVMLQKASELCGEIKALGAALLSALQNKDTEALSMLKTNHEIELLTLATRIKEKQVEEAKESITALENAKALAETRRKHYSQLLSRVTEDIVGLPLNLWEVANLSLQSAAITTETLATLLDLTAVAAHSIPDTTAGSCGMGPCATVTIGGSSAGMAITVSSNSLKGVASALNMGANLSNNIGSFIRRKEEWELQLKIAEGEEKHIQKQIDSAKIRKEIVEQELTHHTKQIEKTETVKAFMQEKFTNQELYSWMVSQISSIYFQSYKLAYDMAKQAERAFRFELGLDDSSYIQFGYWDSLNKGLLAGEKLFHDLKRMEVAYLEKNKRDYEITKRISLLRIDSIAFITLKEIGQCTIKLPEWLFDMDYPGHYFRRIKSVSLTIPCITGPYTSVNCTLTLLSNEIRINNNIQGDYSRDQKNDDRRFFINYAAMQSIATSTAQNDSGLFELSFRDERYLPFEGAGAISNWRIELPKDCNAFDFDTISDVVINLNYTAREGGEKLKSVAKENVKSQLSNTDNEILTRLFSARHEFTDSWHRFTHPASAVGDQTLVLKISKNQFPFMFNKKVVIQEIAIFIKTSKNITNLNLKLLNEGVEILNTETGNGTPPPTLVSFEGQTDLLHIKVENKGKNSPNDGEIVWELGLWKLNGQTHDKLEKGSIKDIFIVCHYLAPPVSG